MTRDARPAPQETRRRVPLRVALVTLVVGLLLLTVASTSLVAAITSARSVQELEDRWFRTTSEAVGDRLRSHLEPAMSALADTADQALAGRVSTKDPNDLGRYLV